MKRCSKCVYPETTRPYINFDDEGVCGGCRVSEEKKKINWKEREKILKDLITPYKRSSGYDCIVPVSGGKDSHFQVYYITQILGLRPLLVTFNHLDNSDIGLKNLENIVYKFGLDHVRFTPNPETVKKCCRHAIKKMGDPFWHEHAGIYTYPVRVAVEKKIPLIIWGEYGFLDLVGMFSHQDFIEMSKKTRQEHGMRGYEPEDFIEGNQEGLTLRDVEFAIYPSDKEIEEIGIKGIYLGNYINWNPISQTKQMIAQYGFRPKIQSETFNSYENAECYYNGSVHDHMKFLKFGYSRATDHASQLIRMGHLTREEGLELAQYFEQGYPASTRIKNQRLQEFCDWIEMNIEDVINITYQYQVPFENEPYKKNDTIYNSALKKVNTLFMDITRPARIKHCGREI